MSGSSMARAISGLLALFGGVLLIFTWGLYLSLWSIIGLALGGLAIYGAYLVFRSYYVRGGTMATAAGIVAWGLYPSHLISMPVLVAIIMLMAGGIMGIVLELAAE